MKNWEHRTYSAVWGRTSQSMWHCRQVLKMPVHLHLTLEMLPSRLYLLHYLIQVCWREASLTNESACPLLLASCFSDCYKVHQTLGGASHCSQHKLRQGEYFNWIPCFSHKMIYSPYKERSSSRMFVRGCDIAQAGAIFHTSTGTKVLSLPQRYWLDTLLYPPSSGSFS